MAMYIMAMLKSKHQGQKMCLLSRIAHSLVVAAAAPGLCPASTFFLALLFVALSLLPVRWATNLPQSINSRKIEKKAEKNFRPFSVFWVWFRPRLSSSKKNYRNIFSLLPIPSLLKLPSVLRKSRCPIQLQLRPNGKEIIKSQIR